MVCLACDDRVRALHHVISKHQLRKVARAEVYTEKEKRKLLANRSNLVPLCSEGHRGYHRRARVIECQSLPDEAISFAIDTLGMTAARNYLHSHYAGEEPRLEEAHQVH